ncbi:hypothetical protein K227x_46880 [Rubripirellula lacrimiformis]|uniref:IPT/TIG domain protein n=1 Tax=Rubripirellula lacrimiformis TaxID=1930273 RepID=A0A517NGL9_9BACT|nr:hypothetical protein [Rubripirellula lacrimiformis]QDT06279.1 hypothetical protein K227x_46880 [Rubripirellula lacrimiformis]
MKLYQALLLLTAVVSAMASLLLQSPSKSLATDLHFALEKSIPNSSEGVSPKLHFSDLTHAAKTGWSASDPKRGAAITVWGSGFEKTRGDSYITVNGIKLTMDADYAEWNADSYDVFFLKRITFWLRGECENGVGSITVTVGGKTSEELPFSIISGRICFVDADAQSPGDGSFEAPWASPNVAVKSLEPGDVLYFRETASPYNKKFFTGKQNFYLTRGNSKDGLADAPIALVSFPGEVATIDTRVSEGESPLAGNFVLARNYWTISKFRLRASKTCLFLGSNDGERGHGIRAVGNDCVGCQEFGSGTAPIATFGSNMSVLGNSSHGGRTNNKLDHAIYISGNPSVVKGVELGWNYAYDNDYAEGPMLVVNHQGNRIPPGRSCKQHDIHHNLIDCTLFAGRGIGIYSMSWDQQQGETEPDRAFVFNNIVLGAGWKNSPSAAAIYCLNGKASIFHNTLVNCVENAITVGGEDVLSVEIENNILHVADGSGYIYLVPGSKSLVIKNNLYYGLGAGPSVDDQRIEAAPSLNRHLIPTVDGPEVNASSANTGVRTDFWGKPRTTGSAADIGACEYDADTRLAN